MEKDEVPVGAVIACGDKIIARTHNLTEQLNDVTAHAEMQAFTSASAYIGAKFLEDCTLYVTLEPCVMCAGAAFWARIGRIVYGAKDEKRGYSLLGNTLLHPRTEISSGVLAEECSSILKSFFEKKRE
jgi:tRNA(adenine34) deaminase